MRVVYIADDGKEFDNEFDCEHYEWMLNHPNLKYIKIYDNRTGELFDDIMTDDAYNYGDKVVIPTEFALKDEYLIPSLYNISSNGFDTNSTC